MNALFRLSLLILAFGYFTPVMAGFQSDTNYTNQLQRKNQKVYVPLERLHFSEEGIFFRKNNNEWLQVEQLGYDAGGYYAASILDYIFPPRHYVASCRNCGYEYHNCSPQPCDNCNLSEGFDLVYIGEDYWD